MKEKIRTNLVSSLLPKSKPYDVFDIDLPGLILRVQPSGLKTYFCACRTKSGTRRRIKLGATTTLTVPQARDEARKVLGDIARGIDPQAQLLAVRKKANEMTLGTFLDKTYGPWANQHLVDASNAQRRIKTCFKALLDKKLSSLDAWAFEAWKSRRRKEGTASTTINRDLTGMRSALSRAVDWGLLSDHPMQKVKPIRAAEQSIVRYLTDEEEGRLRSQLESRQEALRRARDSANAWRKERGYGPYPSLDNLPIVDYVKPAIVLSLNTGLRRGELFSLRWQDIDWQSEVLTVRGAISKSGKTRVVPLNDEAKDVLLDWHQSTENASGLVFPSANGGKRDNCKRVWKTLIRDARIEAFRWHDMRHHFASRLVMAGVDLNTVRELLGHADLKMTLRYAHLAPEHKAAAVAKLVRNPNSKYDDLAKAA